MDTNSTFQTSDNNYPSGPAPQGENHSIPQEKIESHDGMTHSEIGVPDMVDKVDVDKSEQMTFVTVAAFTGLCALFLLLTHVLAPRMRAIRNFNNGILNSIASGMTIAYLFLQSIPALLDNRDLIVDQATFKLLKVPHQATFLIFLMMLLGAVALYTLEKIGADHVQRQEKGGKIAYGFHLFVLGFINFGVAYCMPTFMQSGFLQLFTYILMMGFYFLLEDYTVNHNFPEHANKNYAFVMGGALLLGWCASLVMIKSTPLLSNTLVYAFVVGGMLIVSIKAEFSSFYTDKPHYPSFLMSILFQAIALLLIMLFANIS